MVKEIKSYLGILLGSCIFGVAVNVFVISNGLAQGGFTGIAIIAHYLGGFPVGTANFILNIPVMLIAIKLWGFRFITKTFVGIAASSAVIDLTSSLSYKTDDLLIAAIFGGILAGVGIGLVYLNGGTTGGSDILARIANKYLGVKIAVFYLVFDSLVLGAFAVVYSFEAALYALVMVFVFSKSMDFMLNGLSAAKQVMIISHHNRDIYDGIKTRLRRGGTYFKSEGCFTGIERESLVVIISKYQLFRLKTLVLEIDPEAFIIVTDVHEAWGEGFRQSTHEKPVKKHPRKLEA